MVGYMIDKGYKPEMKEKIHIHAHDDGHKHGKSKKK
jgi:hypothetical protein